MKNAKSHLYISFALSVVLIICSIFAIGVSADNSDTSPKIISSNAVYKDRIGLLFAVDANSVAEGPVTLNLWYSYPENNTAPEKTYIKNAPENVSIKGETHSVYVFETDGVAAKDMADVFYVQAVDSQDDKSDIVSYSVAEYFYERLYGGYTLSEKQLTLYTKSLEYGAAAQNLFTENETPITDYAYYKITDGKVNGKPSGIVEKGSSINITYTGTSSSVKGWVVADNDGNTVTANGNNVTVTTNVTIFPSTACITDFESAPLQYHSTYTDIVTKVDDYVVNNLPSPVVSSASGKYYYQYQIANDPESATNKVLKVSTYFGGTSDMASSNKSTDVSLQANTGDACFTFSTRLRYSSYDKNGNLTQFNVINENGRAISKMMVNVEGATTKIKLMDLNNSNAVIANVVKDQWFDLKVEVYLVDVNAEANTATAITKYYVNGDFVYESSLSTTAHFAKSVQLVHQRGNVYDAYIDDVSFYSVDKVYVAPGNGAK